MKKFITSFFVVLGVVFFVILLALAYLWFADPFELRPLIDSYRSPISVSSVATSSAPANESAPSEAATVDDKNPNLTPAQANALEFIGVDVTALPDSITPDQLACFTRVLGAPRVAEIQSGAAPTPIEILKAKECI